MSRYFNLKVKDIVQETDDTITIFLKPPLFSKIKYEPGQFLTLIVPINGNTYRRAYSLSSSPHTDPDLAVTIKRVTNGVVSNYLNDHLKVGDRLEIMEPIGNFKLVPDKKAERHIVLFGAGSGVTPLMSIAKSILSYEPKSLVSLVYGNRSLDSIIFRNLLKDMEKKYGERFKVVNVLSRPENAWGGYTGRIDRDLTINVVNLLPKLAHENTEYFMCGPEGMMDSIIEALHSLKVPKERIHRESFVSNVSADHKKDHDPNTANSVAQEVTIILDGDEHKVLVQPNSFVLEAALQAGLDIPYSCQSGLCTACRGKCHTGAVKMDEDEGLSEAEINDNFVLTCVARPLTNNVVIEIG